MLMHIASHWACLDYWRWLPLKMLSEWLESIPVSWGYKTKQAKTKLTKTTLLFTQELVRLHTAPALLGVGADLGGGGNHKARLFFFSMVRRARAVLLG